MKSVPSDDPVLLNIISSALEMLDQGIEPPVEQLCGDRADLVNEVRVAIRIAGDLPAVRDRASDLDPYLGRTLRGRYRLQGRLGSGAMGVVYRAEDQELRRDVAVKILRSDTLVAGEAQERFVREAELMAAIRHPSVATLFDRDRTEEGEQFLVMELLEGRSLSDLLDVGWKRSASGALESTDWIQEQLGGEAFGESSYLRLVVEWVADLANGLSAVHQAGTCHRDVKPSNILFGRDGKPQLLDFGIASSEQHATLMREGGALGTPAYMPPEALLEGSVPGPQFDVYGLTATLYHMLTLQAPYSGSPSQIIAALGHREPQPAYQLRPGLPRDLQAILDKGMSRRLSLRYATTLELESDLRAFLQYRPVAARPITPLNRAWRKVRRSTAFHAATAVALLGLVLAGGLRWREIHQEQMDEAFLDVYEHFPPGLTLGAPSSRRLNNEEERVAVQSLLDEAVRWSTEPLPARSLRASFRLDHGDTKGAAQDMQVVASELDTPYTRELADRYTRLASQVGSEESLDLKGMPVPETPMDFYLAGYQRVRTAEGLGDYKAAQGLLGIDELNGFAPAQELLITLIDIESSQLPSKMRTERTLENYARAIRLEELLGRRTANSALVIGTSLLSRELYADAITPLREGCKLTRWSYGLNLNRGIAARRLVQVEEAERHLHAAIALRPGRVDPFQTLVGLYLWEGDLESARKVIADPLFEGNDGWGHEKLLLEALVEFEQMMQFRRSEELELARASAQKSFELYEEAAALLPSSNVSDAESLSPEEIKRRISGAVATGAEERVFELICKLLLKEPLDWRQLFLLRSWMPDQFDHRDAQALRAYIKALSETLESRGN